MKNPIWITVTDGPVYIFDGHQLHWADCFFSNAFRRKIEDFCEKEGWAVKIREMTEDEMERYPVISQFVQDIFTRYGEV